MSYYADEAGIPPNRDTHVSVYVVPVGCLIVTNWQGRGHCKGGLWNTCFEVRVKWDCSL